jgi:hypothetical protein
MKLIWIDEPREAFLIDADCDPELVGLLRKVGFRAKGAWTVRSKHANEDTGFLIWARDHGYILVCHDVHGDTKTKHAFWSEMYYHGGHLIRIGGTSGQHALWALSKILVHRPTWQQHFAVDSGEATVHSAGCNWVSATRRLEQTRYKLRLPFEDPAVPLKDRVPLKRRKGRTERNPPASAPLL